MASDFDPNLDTVLKDCGSTDIPDAKTYVSVSVRSYDGGDAKVCVQRRSVKNDAVCSLGRITIAEADQLWEKIRDAAAYSPGAKGATADKGKKSKRG